MASMGTDRRLADLLDIEKLQSIQDAMAKALDLSFITVDYRGRPVIEYSGFTDYCNAMRKREDRRSLCYQCDAHGGLHATITGEPYIYRCHGGLVDFAVPLILEGKYVGAVMGGQCELVGDGVPELEPILPQSTDWAADPELAEARARVHRMDYGKLVAGVFLVRDMIQNMLEERNRATEEALMKKTQELMEEKAARINLEMAMEGEGLSPFQEYVGEEHLFYVLNIIARMAFREGAAETEQAVCDFAAMMRYVFENGDNNFVTVGEELEYIQYYLRLQKLRLGDRLSYEVGVPEEYYGVFCPFMLLQPLVVNSLNYAVEYSRSGGSVAIRGRADGNALVLTISDSGSGMSRQQIRALLELEGKNKKRQFLTSVNRGLKDVFGQEYGLTILSKEDGFPGTEVQVRLPLSSGSAMQ